MSRPRMPRAPRRLLAIPAVVALVLAVAACDNRSIGNEDPQPQTLIPSAEYAAAHPDTDLASRLADMQGVIDELRSSTGSGWVGRQDDVTGYLGELSGGRWAADDATDVAGTATAFLETYAADLFGVPAEQVVVGPGAETDAGGASSLHATQQIDGVPVLDGGLTMTVGGSDE